MEKEAVAKTNSRSFPDALNTEKNVPSFAAQADNQPRDATEEEIKTLRHVSDRVPSAAWIVILAGAAERATYFGIIAPWRTLTRCLSFGLIVGNPKLTCFIENYMQNARDSSGTPGALGLGQSMATNIFNAFFLFSFLTPMLFALLSDIYVGRYKSLMAGLVYVESTYRIGAFFPRLKSLFRLYLIGCLLLLLTSLPVALDRGAGLPGLILAMTFIGLGAGCIRATYFPFIGTFSPALEVSSSLLSRFVGDQYVQKKPQLLRQKDGQCVIVDGTRTLQLLYNLYYW